jgi:hypothetical protein
MPFDGANLDEDTKLLMPRGSWWNGDGARHRSGRYVCADFALTRSYRWQMRRRPPRPRQGDYRLQRAIGHRQGSSLER